jgi:hypothetical protein
LVLVALDLLENLTMPLMAQIQFSLPLHLQVAVRVAHSMQPLMVVQAVQVVVLLRLTQQLIQAEQAIHLQLHHLKEIAAEIIRSLQTSQLVVVVVLLPSGQMARQDLLAQQAEQAQQILIQDHQ